MIKTVNYSSLDKHALRKEGWRLFTYILGLQLLVIIIGYTV